MATPQESMLPVGSFRQPASAEELFPASGSHRWPGPEPDIHFTVYGIPAPKGSKRAFAIRRGPKGASVPTGQVAVVDDNSARLRDWTSQINAAVHELAEAGCPKLEGAVVMGALFYMPRPASHPKGRRTWPDRKPDLSKLIRALEDPMIGVLFEDDARIVRFAELGKEFAVYTGDDRPRADVALWSAMTWEAWRP